MYNFKQQKIWKIGGILCLSFALLGNESIEGHAQEADIVPISVATEVSETEVSDASVTDVTKAANEDKEVAQTNSKDGMTTISEAQTPMSWIYSDGKLQMYIDQQYQNYTGSKVKMNVLGSAISNNFPGVIYESNVLVPMDKAFKASKIKAECSYDVQTGTITIIKRNRKIVMHPESTKALVNDVEKEMPAAPQIVVDEAGNVVHVMVPAKFVTTSLGYKYTWNSDKKTMKVTRKDMTYFSWANSKNSDNIEEEDCDSISKIVAKYKDGLDTIKISCPNSDGVEVKKSSKSITLTYDDTIFSDGSYSMNLSDAYLARSFSVKQNADDSVKIVLKKTSTQKYYIQQTEDYINIVLGKQPIRIAVDCGHGANTPGKRTPPMPIAIDYNHDGKIDFKKGQCIKEHVPNVGVGKYLADELERCGFLVYRSAFGATDVSLGGRQKNIKNFDSDYSVSVHFNAAGTGKTFNSGRGVEVFYHKNASQAGQSKKFAQTILKYMAKGTPQLNRGVKTMPLALCNTKATGAKASILVECAFMTNYHEATTMVGNNKFWKETAKEIAQGICEYTGVAYVKK